VEVLVSTQTNTIQPTSAPFRPASRGPTLRPNLRQSAVWIALAVAVIVAIVVAPSVVGAHQWPVLLRQAAPLGLLAIGQTVLILGRGFDLSVGGVVGIVNVLAAGSLARNGGTAAVLLACLGVGVIVGALNGAMVAWGRVSPMVATLGTGLVLSGAMLIYTGGAPTGDVPDGIRVLAGGRFLGLSWSTYIWIALSVAVGLGLRYTWPGRWVYALGSNPEAARLAGVRVEWVRFGSHLLSSLCAVVGGLLLAGFVGVGTLGAGQDLMMGSLAATVVGGTLLVGGRGGVSGTVGGAILLTVLSALLTAAGMGKSGNLLTQGIVIIAAAALFRRRRISR
jgi:ribose transport system permease protein